MNTKLPSEPVTAISNTLSCPLVYAMPPAPFKATLTMLSWIPWQICCRLHWWHPHLLWHPWGAHWTHPLGPWKVAFAWFICQTRKMQISRSKNQLFRICHFTWRYFYRSWPHIHYFWLACSLLCSRYPSISWICKFLSSFYWWLLSCSSTNNLPTSQEPNVQIVPCYTRSLWSFESSVHDRPHLMSFRS